MAWLDFISKFGSTGVGNGQFDFPHDIAVNATNIYVVDKFNYRVQKFNHSGVFVSSFGTQGADPSEFSYPNSIAIDSNYIYVTDEGNHRVEVFSVSGSNNYIFQFGSYGFGNGNFRFPYGIAVGAANIYVVDKENNRVQKFDLSGNYTGQFGSSGTGNGQFITPHGIVVDATNIYVVDRGNNRIQKFDLSGNYISQFGSFGTDNGQFNSLSKIAINADFIYVTDYGNNRVQIFDKNTFAFINKFGTTGTGNGQFNGPYGITLYSNYIYVTDYTSDNVQVFNNNAIPDPPTNFKIDSEDGTYINLSWTDNSNIELGFKIEKSLNQTTWDELGTTATDTVTFSATGINYTEINYLRVLAYNNYGNSDSSNVIEFSENSSPVAPSNLTTACGSGMYHIELNWQSNSSIEDGFKIEKSLNNTSWVEIAAVGNGVETYSAYGIRQGQLNYFRIRAFNNSQNSTYTNTASSACTWPDGIAQGISPKQVTIDLGNNETEVWVAYSRNNEIYVIKRDTALNWGNEIHLNAGTNPDIYFFNNKISLVFEFNGKIFYRQWDSTTIPNFVNKPGQLVDCFRIGNDISYNNVYVPFYDMTPYSLSKSGLSSWTWNILSDTNIVNYGYNFYEKDINNNVAKINSYLISTSNYTYQGVSNYSYYVTAEVYNWYEQRGYETNISNIFNVPPYIYNDYPSPDYVGTIASLSGTDLSYHSLASLIIVEVNATDPLIDSEFITGSDLNYQSLASLIIEEANIFDPLIDSDYLVGYDMSLSYISLEEIREGIGA